MNQQNKALDPDVFLNKYVENRFLPVCIQHVD